MFFGCTGAVFEMCWFVLPGTKRWQSSNQSELLYQGQYIISHHLRACEIRKNIALLRPVSNAAEGRVEITDADALFFPFSTSARVIPIYLPASLNQPQSLKFQSIISWRTACMRKVWNVIFCTDRMRSVTHSQYAECNKKTGSRLWLIMTLWFAHLIGGFARTGR